MLLLLPLWRSPVVDVTFLLAILLSVVHGFSIVSIQPRNILNNGNGGNLMRFVLDDDRTTSGLKNYNFRGSSSFSSSGRQKKQLPNTVVYATTKSDTDNDTNQEDTTNNIISANTIYFDIEVANKSIGRLIFHLTNPSPLPLHAENIIQLTKGSRRGIDPKAHYIGCEFDYSPASIEDGMGRYRWGHQLRGRGRNAIGRPDVPIHDPINQLANTHPCYGGQYYGDKYIVPDGGHTWEEPGVLLTVPVLGPGHGSSKFSIVRVGESPKEWGERLLMNSGVIGYLDSNSLEVLHSMARQAQGPPTVVASGVLVDEDEIK